MDMRQNTMYIHVQFGRVMCDPKIKRNNEAVSEPATSLYMVHALRRDTFHYVTFQIFGARIVVYILRLIAFTIIEK